MRSSATSPATLRPAGGPRRRESRRPLQGSPATGPGRPDRPDRPHAAFRPIGHKGPAKPAGKRRHTPTICGDAVRAASSTSTRATCQGAVGGTILRQGHRKTPTREIAGRLSRPHLGDSAGPRVGKHGGEYFQSAEKTANSSLEGLPRGGPGTDPPSAPQEHADDHLRRGTADGPALLDDQQVRAERAPAQPAGPQGTGRTVRGPPGEPRRRRRPGGGLIRPPPPRHRPQPPSGTGRAL